MVLYTEESGYRHQGDSTYDGMQVDLVIDRPDSAIHLCEMKYYADEVVINKKYAQHLRQRQASFKYFTNTRKYLFTTLVTTFGLKSGKSTIGLIDHVITMDQLF